MKIAVKILLFLVLMVINLVGYIVLFSTAYGLKPAQAGKFVKAKIEQVSAGKTGQPLPKDKAQLEKEEFEKSKQQLETEKEDLKRQQQQLLKDKADLESTKKQIEELKTGQSQAAQDKMYGLAKIYDGMDKQQAAKVFSQMDDSLVIAILPKMKSTNASQILQYMEPLRSAQITKMILSGI
jgi:flagellar motility protein MotE (MotC chaperone)